MLTTHALRQELLRLGFVPLGDGQQFSAGPVVARLLDAPRVLFSGPALGLRYVAVVSPEHLTQEVAALLHRPALLLDLLPGLAPAAGS